MKYEPNSEKVRGLIKHAISDKEIQNGAHKAKLTDEILTSQINKRIEAILEMASKEIVAYNELSQILDDKKSLALTILYRAKSNLEIASLANFSKHIYSSIHYYRNILYISNHIKIRCGHKCLFICSSYRFICGDYQSCI